MADVKISELPALTSPDGAEELVVNDGGTTKKITIDNLFNQDIDVTGTVTADGLTVDGVSTLNNHVKVANGYSMGWGDITTRITGNSTSDIISAYTAGSESLRLDAAGNLGLGVVPATWHSNYDVLQMGEQTMLYAHADGIGNDSATYLGTNVYENSGAKYLRTDKSSLYRQQSGKHNFYVAPSGTAGSAISWTNAMTIDNSGKVGINRTPSTAYAKLEVGGADNAALINAEASGVFAGLGVQSGGLGLYVNNSNKMTIDSSGNVGIGSSSPTAKLDVVGPASVTSFTGTTALGMVTRGSTGATDYSGIDFKGNNQTNPIARIAALTTGGGSKLQFGTSNVYGSGITNTAMTIDPTGQVLVGQTTAPSLASALSLKAYTTGGSTPTALKTNTATDGYYAAWFVNAAGANKGYIYTSATATSFSTVSDYRLKTDVQPMTGATARLMQLNPVNFEWISSAGDRVDGFLAHELGAVIPESATGTHNGIKDEEYQATPATGDVYTAAIAEVATESQVMETVETGSYVNLAGETIVETTEQGVTTDLVETVVQRQDVDGVSTEVEVEVTTKVPTMETVITIPAVAEVIHSADVEHPETLEDGQAWRETTAQVIATRSVPDMQGIDQAKVVPILVATIQELIARIEALEA